MGRTHASKPDDPIRNWVLFFTGFLQSEGGRTPLERMQRRVIARCGGPDTIINLNSWRDSPADKAQRIANWRDDVTGKNPRIIVVGFSYGGWTANQLCIELQKHDLPVEALLLCDPVGRWLGNLPSTLSMLNILPLKVPSNVRELYTWRQTANYPRGAKIILRKDAEDTDEDEALDSINQGTVWMEDNHYDYVPHESMDDHPEFAKTILSVSCPTKVKK